MAARHWRNDSRDLILQTLASLPEGATLKQKRAALRAEADARPRLARED